MSERSHDDDREKNLKTIWWTSYCAYFSIDRGFMTNKENEDLFKVYSYARDAYFAYLKTKAILESADAWRGAH